MRPWNSYAATRFTTFREMCNNIPRRKRRPSRYQYSDSHQTNCYHSGNIGLLIEEVWCCLLLFKNTAGQQLQAWKMHRIKPRWSVAAVYTRHEGGFKFQWRWSEARNGDCSCNLPIHPAQDIHRAPTQAISAASRDNPSLNNACLSRRDDIESNTKCLVLSAGQQGRSH